MDVVSLNQKIFKTTVSFTRFLNFHSPCQVYFFLDRPASTSDGSGSLVDV